MHNITVVEILGCFDDNLSGKYPFNGTHKQHRCSAVQNSSIKLVFRRCTVNAQQVNERDEL
jgi:hypothetical protein